MRSNLVVLNLSLGGYRVFFSHLRKGLSPEFAETLSEFSEHIRLRVTCSL
jgi:hypothetical protein